MQVLHKLYPCEKKTLFNRLTKERIDKCSINLGYYGYKHNVYTIFLLYEFRDYIYIKKNWVYLASVIHKFSVYISFFFKEKN